MSIPVADPALINRMRSDLIVVRTNLSKLNDRDRFFALSLIQQFDKKRTLSEAQAPYTASLRAKIEPTIIAPTPVARPAVDLSGVVSLFDIAAQNLKFPRIYLTTDGVDYVLARNGRGMVNLQTRGAFENRTWFGVIERDGSFKPSKAFIPAMLPLLQQLAAHPKETAQMYGKQFGVCCLCGRELTNPVSIANGIGPVCATKFGF